MIPVLYENAERLFTSNGIGRLSDCISCTVTEERNGVYECEFEYPITGLRYGDIQEERVITVTHDDTGDIQPFDIYGRSAPIDGVVTFYAHHVSYRLSDVVIEPFTAQSCAEALDSIVHHSINSNPFTFWTDKTTSGEFSVDVPDYAKAILGGQQGSILDVFGKGDYEFDKWTVKLHTNRGVDSGVEIRYGKNLSDITHELDISGTYNAVVPYWVGSDGTLVMLPEKILIYSGATQRLTFLTDEQYQVIHDENGEPIEVTYSITDAVPLDLSSEFEEQPTISQLRNLATSKLETSEGWIPKENIKVDFVQLWQTEEYKDYAPLQRVRLCDTVSVFYPELGVEAVKQKVIKTVYNVLLDRYDSIELGELQSTLAGTIEGMVDHKLEEVPDIGFLDKAIYQATQLITGGLGGYVVLKQNANGKPEELLVMDNEDINQAVNVWRWNKNGIGYSSTGYNGTYRTAWTIDGSFVADFITSGTMSANLIRGGTLRLGGLNNVNGLMQVLDADGNVITTANNNGIQISKGSINLGNGKFIANTDGAVTAKSFTANDYVYVNGNSNSFLKIPTAAGTDRYLQVSSGGFKIVGSIATITAPLSSKNYCLWIEHVTDSGAYAWLGPGGIRATHGSNGDYAYLTTDGAYRLLVSTAKGVMMLANSTGTLTIPGSLLVTGTKSRRVETKDYSDRLLYCYETPAPLFGDIGEGVIGEDGKCYVWLDPIFAETISTDQYQVFLQKYGSGECYVSERKPNCFVVEGDPGLSFGWELKAKQADVDQLRLERHIPEEDTEEINYAEEAIQHIAEIRERRSAA